MEIALTVERAGHDSYEWAAYLSASLVPHLQERWR
jgi:hypothetical protein